MLKKFPAARFYNYLRVTIIWILLAIGFLAVQPVPTVVNAQEDFIPQQVGFTENFDAVTAPTLPTGWTTTAMNAGTVFVTRTDRADTLPNAVFTTDPSTVGSAQIDSTPIRLGGNAPKLIFRHAFGMEAGFDGGVLEIKIGSGAFQDILAAGGSFVQNGYRSTLNASGNPIGGRMAWNGFSAGSSTAPTFITTEVNLPVAAYRQTVQFRWLSGSDSSVAGTGWWIDTVQVTNAVSGENGNAISIPASGVASPYPSEINITDHVGLVSSVQVNLTNFSHSSPDDVDLMLVAPNGRKVVLMSDVGGSNPVTNLNISFDDSAAASLPDNAPLSGGNYKPTNFEPNDAFPAPAPQGAPTGNLLSSFNGSEPNGAWKLFLFDDNGENAGSLTGGWSIVIQTSPDLINIPETGAAQPYPSQFAISGLQGSVTKAVVTLKNFSHLAPDDVDVLLVAPNGRRIVLMSDVGGNTEVGGLNLTFDDTAASNLPDNAPLASGTYKPTDYDPGDSFPAPAPTGATTGATLNAFYGSPANGVWKLFVVDDNGNNFGSVGDGFSLNLQTSTTACTFTLSSTGQGFPIIGGSGSFSINMPAGCPWMASTNSSFVSITSSATGEGVGTINFTVAPNMSGGRTASIVVTNGVFSQTFLIQQPSGCPFSLASTVQNFTATGGAGSVAVAAGSTCGYQATSSANWIQVTSGNQTGDATVSFTVTPNTSAAQRSGTITIGARTLTINQAGGVAAIRFDFDGDGKSDVSVFRPSNGFWYVLNSLNNSLSATQFGLSSDVLVPADYDGDAKTDIAVFRRSANSTWYILQSQTNTFRAAQFGASNEEQQLLLFDKPLPADYDGDGRADLALYRRTDNLGEAGRFLVLQSASSVVRSQSFGDVLTDTSVPADYDGDGRTDFAVFRTSTGVWYVLKSSDNNLQSVQFGQSGDRLVPADYDGDGKTDQAVFRNGTWYINRSRDGFYGAQFGLSTDKLVPADYDGDGKTDFGVVRNGTWYILHLGNQTFRAEQWGFGDDTPIPSVYIQP